MCGGTWVCLSVCVRVCNEGQRAFGSVCARVLYILHYSGAHLPLLFLPCLVSTLQGGWFCRLDVFSAGAALIFELREKSSFTLLSRKTHTPHILNLKQNNNSAICFCRRYQLCGLNVSRCEPTKRFLPFAWIILSNAEFMCHGWMMLSSFNELKNGESQGRRGDRKKKFVN